VPLLQAHTRWLRLPLFLPLPLPCPCPCACACVFSPLLLPVSPLLALLALLLLLPLTGLVLAESVGLPVSESAFCVCPWHTWLGLLLLLHLLWLWVWVWAWLWPWLQALRQGEADPGYTLLLEALGAGAAWAS